MVSLGSEIHSERSSYLQKSTLSEPKSSFHSLLSQSGPNLSRALALTPFTSPRTRRRISKSKGSEAYLHSTFRKFARAKPESMFYNKTCCDYTHGGKNHFPGRRSSVYTESGKLSPAAPAHILGKRLELAAGEAAQTKRLFPSPENRLLQLSRVLGTHGEQIIPVLPLQKYSLCCSSC